MKIFVQFFRHASLPLLLTAASLAQADSMPMDMSNGGMNPPGMSMDDMKKGHHYKTMGAPKTPAPGTGAPAGSAASGSSSGRP